MTTVLHVEIAFVHLRTVRMVATQGTRVSRPTGTVVMNELAQPGAVVFQQPRLV